MITFWIVTGVLTLLALAFLLPAALGKANIEVGDIDQNTLNARIARERLASLEAEFEGGAMSEEDYQTARTEVESNLLDDVDAVSEDDTEQGANAASHWMPVVVGLSVPVIAIVVYLQLGDLNAVDHVPPVAQAASATSQAHAAGGPEGVGSLEKMAKTLAARLEKEPEDLKGWSMLGRTYGVLQRYADAAFAYQTALSLSPKDTDVMVNLAEALAMSAGGRLEGQPRELLDQALVIEPENAKGLWLNGMAHFQAGEFKGAVDNWMPVLTRLPAGSPAVAELSGLVREAAEKGGFPAPEQAAAPLVDQLPQIADVAPAAQSAPPASPAAGGAAPSIKVSVSLSPELADKVKPGDSLFIFARATAGPKMPLAAMRLKATDLPITVMLNDQMAMLPNMNLSSRSQVLVGARISSTGQAIPAAGDLFGEKSPVEVKADQAVNIVINQVK